MYVRFFFASSKCFKGETCKNKQNIGGICRFFLKFLFGHDVKGQIWKTLLKGVDFVDGCGSYFSSKVKKSSSEPKFSAEVTKSCQSKVSRLVEALSRLKLCP